MKNTIVSAFITGYVWLGVIVTLIPAFLIYLIIWILTLPFDTKRIYCHHYVSLWAGFYIHINPLWKVKIENRFKVEPGQAYIVLSNHQSMLDILAIYQLHFPFRWISKQELFRIPVIGWVLFLNKYITVVRGDKTSADNMISHAVKSLKQGISILIFPEGTRSADGNIGTFKEGAFRIAQESKAKVLPIIIDGAYDAMPKKDFVFRRKQPIVIRILDAVKPEDYMSLTLPQLIRKMEMLMAEEFTKLRNENILLYHE
ncbi:MAG: 1-acylglycerol-3-phosphate O-acyltransferase [Bacteroidales bacterium]|nr:1-acylglycerol-3-phosphate O-acyltransferase [Bacteroidales bacterium]